MMFRRITASISLIAATEAFQISQPVAIGGASSLAPSQPSSTSLYHGNMEQIEFKIFPDGRIEESVRGIKGGECHKVTDEINAHLGKVVATTPTEEMFEEKILIEETVSIDSEQKNSGWDGASSW